MGGQPDMNPPPVGGVPGPLHQAGTLGPGKEKTTPWSKGVLSVLW